MTMSWDEESERKCQAEALSKLIGEGVRASLQHRHNDFGRDRIGEGRLVRWERIQELRLAIASGTYRISADQVADSMMRFARHDRIEAKQYSA